MNTFVIGSFPIVSFRSRATAKQWAIAVIPGYQTQISQKKVFNFYLSICFARISAQIWSKCVLLGLRRSVCASSACAIPHHT